MKSFILYVALFIVSACSGAGAMHFFDRYTFEQWTDIEFQRFSDSRDRCLETEQGDCGLFGGFAPRSQIQKN